VASTRKLQLFDNVLETLAKLKKAGKKLYILSNAQASFTPFELKKLGLPKYFNGIVLSSKYGVAKPSAKFFDIIFDKYHLAKEDCIYIGNDLHSDILGANNAGIDSIWLNTGHLTNDTPHTPTYTIDDGDFAKICDILL
jgi:putative hydrolase of the HAD superfamily